MTDTEIKDYAGRLIRYPTVTYDASEKIVREIVVAAEAQGFKRGMERAAAIADDYDGDGLDSTGYYDQSGNGRLTQRDIVKAIQSAAATTNQTKL